VRHMGSGARFSATACGWRPAPRTHTSHPTIDGATTTDDGRPTTVCEPGDPAWLSSVVGRQTSAHAGPLFDYTGGKCGN